jgi:hypothetical protein
MDNEEKGEIRSRLAMEKDYKGVIDSRHIEGQRL